MQHAYNDVSYAIKRDFSTSDSNTANTRGSIRLLHVYSYACRWRDGCHSHLHFSRLLCYGRTAAWTAVRCRSHSKDSLRKYNTGIKQFTPGYAT